MRFRGSLPLLGANGVPLVPEGPQLPNLALHLRLRRQGGTGRFQCAEGLLGFFRGFPGLGDLVQTGFHFGVGQGLLVVIQLPQPVLDLVNAHFQLLALGVQGFQLGELFFNGIPLGFRLGKQSRAVVAAAVFQILQAGCQPVCRAAVIAGGDESVETAAQGLVLRHWQVRKPDEPRPTEHGLLHAEERLAAVCRRQLLHRQAGFRFVGLEFPQGHPAAGGALDGNVPAVPV